MQALTSSHKSLLRRIFSVCGRQQECLAAGIHPPVPKLDIQLVDQIGRFVRFCRLGWPLYFVGSPLFG